MFLNCLLFSSLVPFIPFFGAIYFWIKYIVDKNNMLFVYIHKEESGGQLRNGTKNFLVFILVFYMIVMSSFYANNLGDRNVFIVGIVLTLITYVCLLVHFKTGGTIKNL